MAKTPEYYESVSIVSPVAFPMFWQHLTELSAPDLGQGEGKPDYDATFEMRPDHPVLTSALRISLEVLRENFPEIVTASAEAIQDASHAALVGAMASLKQKHRIHFPFQTGAEVNAKREKKGKSRYSDLGDDVVLFSTKAGKNKDKTPRQPILGTVASGKPVVFVPPGGVAMNADKFYNGAEAYFKVQFAAGAANGNMYVKAYLNKVVLNGKGSPRSGGASIEEFGQFMGKVTNEAVVDGGLGL